jgi:hypothetical protein
LREDTCPVLGTTGRRPTLRTHLVHCKSSSVSSLSGVAVGLRDLQTFPTRLLSVGISQRGVYSTSPRSLTKLKLNIEKTVAKTGPETLSKFVGNTIKSMALLKKMVDIFSTCYKAVLLSSSQAKKLSWYIDVTKICSYCCSYASCPMGTGGPFPGAKAQPGRDADHSPSSSAEVENE